MRVRILNQTEKTEHKDMAEKIIKVEFGGNPVPLETGATIKREDLYGKQKKSVEQDGAPLEKVILTPEGEIYSPEFFTLQKIDSDGAIEGPTTICGEDGLALPLQASSYKEARAIKEIGAEEAVLLKTSSVIPIQTPVAELPLAPGFYKTTYNFRDSYETSDAVINVTPEGGYILIGEFSKPPMAAKEETYAFFEEEAAGGAGTEDDEEMSFGMF
jgi:hypothetical protein